MTNIEHAYIIDDVCLQVDHLILFLRFHYLNRFRLYYKLPLTVDLVRLGRLVGRRLRSLLLDDLLW